MTVKYLIKLLKNVDPDSEIYIRYEHVEDQGKSVTLVEEEVNTVEESKGIVILY